MYYIRDILEKSFHRRNAVTADEFFVLGNAVGNMMKNKPALSKGESLKHFTEAEQYHFMIRKQFCNFLLSVWHNLPFSSNFDPPTKYESSDHVNFPTIMAYVGEKLHDFLFFSIKGQLHLNHQVSDYHVINFPDEAGNNA